jgi:iron(III) transport system substrate-binding protein
VLDPKWKHKVLIRNPVASGTMRAIFGMIVERGIAATGDTAAGFDWLRRLDTQTTDYPLNPALLHQKLLRQEGLLTLWDLPDILVEQGRGSPFGYVLPASGTPVIEDPIAVVRGARHQEAARRFVDWVGSEQAQILAAQHAWRLPARLNLPRDSIPEWVLEVRSGLRYADMDWQLLAERGPEWMTYWDRHVRGRGGESSP